jgi:uncharacterized protein (DUF1800 family)
MGWTGSTGADAMPTNSLRPIAPSSFGTKEARTLLERTSFGAPPDGVRALAEMTPRDAVDSILEQATGPVPDVREDEFDADIMSPPTDEQRRAYQRARQSGDEDTLARFRRLRQERQQRDRRQGRELQTWWLARMARHDTPFREKMTLFWHGHFATSYRGVEDSYHLFMQNQTFRLHAIGNFGELAHRIVRDPAMIAYLDNNASRHTHPNENLARELMELFCLGEGAYSESDIRNGARALTGYTFDDDAFVFRHQWHDKNIKHILGKSGNFDGDDFVDIILARRDCPIFITTKLYEYLVSGPLMDLSDADRRVATGVIRRLARVLQGRNYELRPMLEQLLLSEHFYDFAGQRAMVKSPIDLVVGAMRTLDIPARDPETLLRSLDVMGQTPFAPPSVKGWDGGRAWINTSTLFARHNTMTYLLTGVTQRGKTGETYDPMPLIAGLPDRSPRAVCARLLDVMIGSLATEQHADVLADFLAEHGDAVTPQTLLGVLALISTMPEFQLT